jgi:hypothetical protein
MIVGLFTLNTYAADLPKADATKKSLNLQKKLKK